MVMAQSYYGYPDGLEFCRRSAQGVTLPLSQSTRRDNQQDISDGGSSRVSPASESDAKGNGPPRRRIQVACERCRKRKIKCSGDTGNGQGCMNCRNSGTPNCRFLRVNSAELQPKASYSNWPYPAIGSIVPSTRPQASNYGTHGSSRTSSLSVESPTLRTVPYSRPQSGYDNGGVPQSMLSRNSYSSGCNINYEDDSSTLYNIPSPAFMLPNADSTNMPGYCGSPGSPKIWNTVAHVSAATPMNGLPTGLYTDRDQPISLGPSGYSYLGPPLPHVPTSTDIPSLFPAMNSLTSNLSGCDRTLPNPATGRNQPFSNTSAPVSTQSESSPNMSFSAGPLLTYKSSGQWAPDSMGSSSSQGSIRTMSSSALSANADGKTTSSSPQDMGFGYTMSGSPPPGSMNSTTPYTDAETVDSTDAFQTSTESGLDRHFYSKDDILSDSCGSGVYGYSTERSGRRGATDCSSGTLISGQQYTRVRQPQPHGTPNFNILRTAGTPDFRPETANLPSVTSLGNTAGF